MMGKREINVRKIFPIIMNAMENLGQWLDFIVTIAQNTSSMRKLRQLSLFCQLLHDLLSSFNIQDPLRNAKILPPHNTPRHNASQKNSRKARYK